MKVGVLGDDRTWWDLGGQLLGVAGEEGADLDPHLVVYRGAGFAEPAAVEGHHHLLSDLGGVGFRSGGILDRGEGLGWIDLDADRSASQGQEVEDEAFEFNRIRLGRLHPLALAVQVGDLFAGAVKGQGGAILCHPAKEGQVEGMHGDAARPEDQRPVVVPPLSCLQGQVAVLDHPADAVDLHHVAHLFQRIALGHDLQRVLAVRQHVTAQELGLTNRGQGVIDLEIKQVLQTPPVHFVQGAAALKGGQHPSVAVRAGAQRAAVGQQQMAGLGIDGGHRPLAEDDQVLPVEPVALLAVEELAGGLVRGGAGHDVQGNRGPVPGRRRPDLLDKNLKQRRAREGADRVHPLGMGEAQPSTLAAGDQDGRHMARPQFGLAALPRFGGRERPLIPAQPDRRRRRGPQGHGPQVLHLTTRSI